MWTDEARQASIEARQAGAHASKVDQIGRPVLSPKVLDVATQNPDGFSVTPRGQQPTTGFMVSLPGHSLVVSAAELSGPKGRAILEDYAKTHAAALTAKGSHLGGWTDKASGKTYIDVSQNIKNRNAAIKAGAKRNQIAIWDVRKGREIPTGGTGK